MTWIDGLAIVPLSSAIPQHFARSAGRITRDQLAEVARAAIELRGSRRTLVMAQHHPPKRHRGRLLQWFDGLQNAHEVEALLQTHAHLHVLHGHWHKATSLPFLEGPARVFGADKASAGMVAAERLVRAGARVGVNVVVARENFEPLALMRSTWSFVSA